MAFDVETDQQVAADAHKFPEDEHHEDVAGQDQSEHREAEQREVSEEPVEPPGAVEVRSVGDVHLVVYVFLGSLVIHVPDRKDVDAGCDQGDHREHHQRQAVDVIVDGDANLAEGGQFVKPATDVLVGFLLGGAFLAGGGGIGDGELGHRVGGRRFGGRGVVRVPQRQVEVGDPENECREAQQKPAADAADREVGCQARPEPATGRVVRPVAAEDLDGEADEWQQPRGGQQAGLDVHRGSGKVGRVGVSERLSPGACRPGRHRWSGSCCRSSKRSPGRRQPRRRPAR